MAFSWFDPTTWPSNTFSQSILPGWSLFTVNETNSSNPGMEQRILAKNSYGRQIGRMMDVMEMLVKANPDLAKSDAGKAFEDLRTEIEAAKTEAKGDASKKLLADLKALKETDPKAFKDLIGRVEEK